MNDHSMINPERLGPFRIVKSLGSGAFKTVYEAMNTEPEKNGYPERVALCVPHTRDRETRELLQKEYSTTRAMEHPGIVRVYGVEEAGECSFMVMEVVEGKTLKEVLEEKGPMDLKVTAAMMGQLGEALDYAHLLPAMHRDIKPANIICCPDGNLKILDFGLARLLAHSRYMAGTRVGTIPYMAPEQFDGAAGTRADLWSLGVTFFQLVTGALPFPGRNDSEVIKKILYDPPTLEPMEKASLESRLVGIMSKILEKEPDKRYATAAAFTADLEAVLRHGDAVNRIEGEIEVLLRSHFPLIFINSHEEKRVLLSFKRIQAAMSGEKRMPLHIWSETRGLCGPNDETTPGTAGDPLQALAYAASPDREGIFLFLDIHRHFTPVTVRMIRDVVWTVKRTRKSLVFVSPVLSLPPELETDATLLFYGLPDVEDLKKLVTELATENTGDDPKIVEGALRDGLARAVLGLTHRESERVLRRAALRRGGFDKGCVLEALGQKQQIVRKSGLLEYCDPSTGFGDIGGLDPLKIWFYKRRMAYSPEGARFGLKPPKGVVLSGVPGCGKSLTAKALSSEWNVPLLRMDLGRIRSGYVGASEANLRRALSVADAVSPCVLWIDELEKAFGGLGQDQDSGVSQRIFGAFLTWLEEKRAPVFVVATANDVTRLPPEFTRKGRFDELFFVDLPREREREDIFKVHILKRNRDPEAFELKLLVKESVDYSGAEIEEAVISGLYAAFMEEERDLNTEDILKSLKEIKPVAHSRATDISRMRQWAAVNARGAQ